MKRSIFLSLAVWALLGSVLFIGRGGFNLYGQQVKPSRPAVASKKTAPAKPPAYFLINQNGKFGYIDRAGKIVVTPQFDGALPFKEGLAPVWVGEKCGFIDKTGNFVIEPAFDDVSIFSEGLAPVAIGKQWGFIDKTGRMVIAPRFSGVDQFSEGLAHVFYDDYGIRGYINKSGNIVFSDEKKKNRDLSYWDRFSEGLTTVTVGKGESHKGGYVDKSGQIVIPAKFEHSFPFSEGLGRVISGEYGFVDKTGQFVISPQFYDAGEFQEGLALVQLGDLWGYIDKTGKQVIGLEYADARPFSEGLAAVKVENKWGYINKAGTMAIQPQFDDVDGFVDGLAKVAIRGMIWPDSEKGETQGQVGYIDKTGKYVWGPAAP